MLDLHGISETELSLGLWFDLGLGEYMVFFFCHIDVFEIMDGSVEVYKQSFNCDIDYLKSNVIRMVV